MSITNNNLNGRLWSESNNVGKNMISKLGWQPGEGLGKKGQGITTHVKVSLKAGRDGIGMRTSKTNNCSLLQTFDYDMLLKSKYAAVNGNTIKEEVPRSMTRGRFGRAVRADFYKPLDANDWTNILGSDKTKENIRQATEEILDTDVKSDGTDSKFLTNKININDYFETRMREKMKNNNSVETVSIKVEVTEEEKFNIFVNEENKPKEYENEVLEKQLKIEKKSAKEKIREVNLLGKVEVIIANDGDEKVSRKRKRKENRDKELSLSERLNNTEAMLSEVDHLLETAATISEKKIKQSVQVIELCDTVNVPLFVKRVSEKSERSISRSILDTSNLRDIQGYKYY